MEKMTDFSDHISSLKKILISLEPVGPDGFEGLIGTALSKIADIPFRLAGSGLQFGVDGKSTYADDGISYECKRYTDSVPRAEIMSKIAELRGTDTDLWVICATSQINSQIADEISEFGEESAVSTLILDWSEIGLPPLAVALALASEKVRNFLRNHITPESLTKAKDALAAIEKESEFESHAERIRGILREPTLGMDTARQANTNWLTEAFSNKQLAKRHFNQPLSPLDETNRVVHPRDNLVAELSPYLTGEPSEKILCVLGDEGNGKSWLVAQSWLSVKEKPLMVVLSPSAEMKKKNNVQELLISALIEQTGDHAPDLLKKKWSKILDRWRKQSVERLRLVVLIDGLNQRRKMDWGRILERFSAELKTIGGQLIVTAQTPYYQNNIRRRITVASEEMEIPEWTDHERDRILADREISVANLHPKVAVSLRNPRLLGIAFELLEGADIACLEELNVSRLLFEHIRLSEQDAPILQPVHEFVQQLRRHAKEVILRIQARQEDDLVIFEQDHGTLNAVADGRFFHSLEGDPTRYKLEENGLTLALGLAVIERLQFALRNKHDLNDTLEKVIAPPITTLDMTASVILSALTVTCIDNEYPDDFATALIQTFADLQNPDEDEFASFAYLARTRPTPFIEAASNLCLSGGHQINFDWVQTALIKARADNNAWGKIFKDIKTWLSYYTWPAEKDLAQGTSETSKNKKTKKENEEQKSLGPAIRERLQVWGETWKEERKKEKEQRTQKNIEALSKTEKNILAELIKMDGDLNTLSRFAFILLTGKPIEPAAHALVQWSFANALNADLMPPDQELRDLIRFNHVDWSDTRVALLKEVNVLRSNEISVTGKWALVNVLQAIGSLKEAKQARILVDKLTENRPHFPSWRLVEDYCTTDPCDPRSEKPDNVQQTAQNYKDDIDVSQIWVSRGQTSADLFLAKARPGMARFEAQVAVAKHREFARDVMHRKGSHLLPGLFGLREHNALVRRKEGRAFANLQKSEYIAESDLFELDRWRIFEYCLFLAFPFLSGREQIDALISATQEGGIFYRIIYKLMDVAKPIEETVFDNLLESACQKGDEHAQYVLLRFARATSTPISAKSRKYVTHMLEAQSERVRVQILGIISQLDDVKLLTKVVHSGWQASEGNQRDEAEYGSAILTQAAARGIIDHHSALNRMSPSYYGQAVQEWIATGAWDAVREVALRVDASICRVANIDADLTTPDIENDAYLEFRNGLTDQKCDMILGNFDLDKFRTIVEANESLANRWYEMLIGMPESRLPAVRNLVLHFVYGLSNSNSDKAAELFYKVRRNSLDRIIISGCVAVSLSAMEAWSGPDAKILNELRFQRLDRAANNHELSQEVLIAHLNDKQDLLRQYIEAKLKKEEPAEIARAIMVAGFSDYNEFNGGVLKQYQDTDGFIGDAHNAAQYAYERNSWARHWFSKMCEADEADEFWRFSILFAKIVDGRYEFWRSEYRERNEPMQLFWPSVRIKLKNRLRRWETLRKKKLFGGDAPEEIFLFPE